jgi:hypothetical protein
MSTVADIITDVRYEISDEMQTRFSDNNTLLSLVKKAVRRASRVAQRNGLQFAKSSASIPTVANQNYVALPTDFDTVAGDKFLFKDRELIIHLTQPSWEAVVSAGETNFCLLDPAGGKIYLKGTPTSVETLTLWYYPAVDATTFTVATAMPWGGRLDDIISEYVSLRAKNIDEMEAGFDLQLLTDLENQILEAYRPVGSTVDETKGWL